MNIYVLNDKFEYVGVIDSYSSVIWTTRYYEAGDFELYFAADQNVLNMIRSYNYLVREQDINGDELRNVMLIDNPNITIKTDVENGDYITVTGKCLKSIVSRRIVINQTLMNGKLHACINRLLSENIIEPSDIRRMINNFAFENTTDFNINITMQTTGDNLGSLITEICKNYGLGWDIYIKKNKFVFYLYKGVDRSLNQSVNPHVVFSYEFDNLISSDYKENTSKYANVAIVAGEGEGASRKKLLTGDTGASGLNRYEIFVDSRNVSSNDGEISETEYNKMLAENGNEKLADLQKVISYEGEVDATRNYVLNRDFFIGDLVQVVNNYGISKSTRIIEIIDAEDENGQSVIPTFSDF